METTLAAKAYLAFLTPLLASLLGVYSHLTWYILIPVIACISVISMKMMFQFLFKIALKKKVEARKKYENQSFKNLKLLVLSNPEEAALFIETRKARPTSLSHQSLNQYQLSFKTES